MLLVTTLLSLLIVLSNHAVPKPHFPMLSQRPRVLPPGPFSDSASFTKLLVHSAYVHAMPQELFHLSLCASTA